MVITSLDLMKANLGITSTARDTYLQPILDGVKKELVSRGLTVDETDAESLLFLADLAAWRFRSRAEEGAMPRNLQYRLHNLLIHNAQKEGGDADA